MENTVQLTTESLPSAYNPLLKLNPGLHQIARKSIKKCSFSSGQSDDQLKLKRKKLRGTISATQLLSTWLAFTIHELFSGSDQVCFGHCLFQGPTMVTITKFLAPYSRQGRGVNRRAWWKWWNRGDWAAGNLWVVFYEVLFLIPYSLVSFLFSTDFFQAISFSSVTLVIVLLTSSYIFISGLPYLHTYSLIICWIHPLICPLCPPSSTHVK